jgi:hypothetical protein
MIVLDARLLGTDSARARTTGTPDYDVWILALRKTELTHRR